MGAPGNCGSSLLRWGSIPQYSAIVLGLRNSRGQVASCPVSYTRDLGSQPPPLSRPRYVVHVPIKVAPHKLLDSSLALSMEVLELMHGGELFHIQPIGGHDIWGWGRRSMFQIFIYSF